MDDMLLEDFVFLLMEDRRSFASEAEWVEACKGDPASLEVKISFAAAENSALLTCVCSHDHPLVSYSITHAPLQVSAVREPGGSGGGSGRLGPKLPLAAYSNQVAGHAETLLMMGSAKLCKPMRDVELSVYLAVFGEGDDGSDESHDALGSEAQHVLQARAKSKPEVWGEGGGCQFVTDRHPLSNILLFSDGLSPRSSSSSHPVYRLSQICGGYEIGCRDFTAAL